ncbi:Kef-type K+ transport system, membrane component KefB [Streptomyces sp. TLI_053]|uniref:cation:proton antiporter n=1 Tax=Streptomyces sp. TLI_053 TaxID=1855352 RepID=UPI0008796363|nr:cation:proton antiporter [Streptomyces sp. TLI_053]SDS75793.1 Kef-type K+ transport system, membrane component KefB [Streptomyces sp. TLI_053]
MGFPSLGEHAQWALLVQLLAITALAHAAGAGVRRLGQPAVIGHLLAGVLLGPSVLGLLWSDGARLMIPQERLLGAPLNAVAWLGAAFLLLLTGLDTDLNAVRRLGRPTLLIGAGAVLLPFAAGLALALALPASFAGARAGDAAFVLLVAVSLSISSIPVVARILSELGFMQADFGRMILAVALASDALGWLALAAVTVASGPSAGIGALAAPLAGLVLLTAAVLLAGPRLVDAVLTRLPRRGTPVGDGATGTAGATGAGGHGELLTAVVLVLLLAVAAQAAGSDGLLGAFAAGVLIGRSPHHRSRLRAQLEPVTLTVLAPVFFAVAGLRMDLTALGGPGTLLWAAGYLAVAVGCKIAGAYGGARLAGLPSRQGLAVAVGLNCRGAIEVVVASVGLSAGVLSERGYTVIVLMALITTVMTGPLLRAVVPRAAVPRAAVPSAVVPSAAGAGRGGGPGDSEAATGLATPDVPARPPSR